MATDIGGEFERPRTETALPFSGIDARRALRGSIGVTGFLVVWHVAAVFQPDYILPSPLAVSQTFYIEAASGEMFTALGASISHWIPGAIIGTMLGIVVGIALAWSSFLDDLTTPVVRVLRPVPPLALIGFAIAWFGINHAGAAFVIAIGAFWINFYAAYGGVEGVSEDLLDVARSLGVSSDFDLVKSVVVPAASPEIMTGIRTGLGRCWMLVVASEIFGVPGIGRRILRAGQNLQVDVVIAYIFVLSLMFLLVDVAFRMAQRRLLRWR